MPLNDKDLDKKLHKMIDKLERLVDEIGPTPLRHLLSEHVVAMRMAIRRFDQATYDQATYEE